MARREWRRCVLATLAVFVAVTTGCVRGADQTRYYVLTSLPDGGSAIDSPPGSAGPAVGVGPVRIPAYLDRAQIATQNGRDEIVFSEFDTWAEPLRDNLARIVAENLSVLVPSERVAVFPWPASRDIDYQVLIDVTRFDRGADREVRLAARWRIVDASGKELVLRTSRVSETAGDSGHPAAVAAMSRAAATLSRDIAAEIGRLRRGG